MLTQEYKAGDNLIKVEIAENLDDAKKHNFNKGQYSRYIVNGKVVEYGTMIQFIATESRNIGQSFVPPEKELKQLQFQLLQNQKKEIIRNLENLKTEYSRKGVIKTIIDDIDHKIKTINLQGMRVKE